MTSKERVAAAMRQEVPDRVPVMCQLAAGHYFLHSGIDPMDIWFDSQGWVEAFVRMQQRYQFDGILVNICGREPGWRRFVDRIESKPGEAWVHWKNGGITKFPPDDNPHYYLENEQRYFPAFSQIAPQDLYYIEPWDMTDITYPYTWCFDAEPRPFHDFFPDYLHDPLKGVIARVGDSVSVHSEVFSPFSQFLELLNYEAALMALLDDPEKCHDCLAALVRGTVDLALRQAACGVEAVLISSAFAGSGFLSPRMYEEFVLPYEQSVIRQIKAQHPDLKVYTHTCGGIGDRLDLMMETGLDGIDTLDPPPLGTCELADAVAQTKGKIFIKGNLDPVNSLLLGDRETVREAVEERLRVAAPGGGFILSSACSVAPPTKPELLEYMSALVRGEN